ncbi:hypothetical protein Kpol_457p8 [Vanderwaltozyma polyspora DSM 70294]|uniref:Arrestin C-terminal-like domain-containing protein n=1 Tax=Vanderwaltozyma polyspora (strain ATCC 22028 / DSM 70294 / BCRC 21397 / CBS 2163 / NBRC 10782 / NRRL Y-8283 / UCD 57-17) TaxID=436907 RepID=A7TQU9_VANPO|nr:uncharacterized protein Kpol_457p8 [Vanderwaltozyma polyspora DSM 70294]EDO15357.1 hypothetical protein Kpol_457p8 [Vanderwaltozyma polyspora DSM 70294]
MTKPIISLKPSYNSVIRGCPGLPDTLPRIECELRIRSNDGKPFRIEKIEIVMKTIESLNSSHSFSSKPKFEKTTVHYKKNVKLSDNVLIGIDIPVTIGLPDDIKETNFNNTFGKTITLLECNVHYNNIKKESSKGDTSVQSYIEVINVERYIYLASRKLFPPTRRKFYSPDKKFVVMVSIDNPCVTTDDLLRLHLEIKHKNNQSGSISSSSQKGIFNKKVKLKSINYELKEYLEINDTNILDSRENVLNTAVHQTSEVLSSNPVNVSSDIRVFTKNEYFKEFETTMQEPAFLFKVPHDNPNHSDLKMNQSLDTKLLQNKTNGLIPFQYHTSITTSGQLYTINHALDIKFKISNGRDFEIRYPVDVSPWPRTQIKYIEQVIDQERETAKFATQFYEGYGGIKRNKHTNLLDYPSLPPMVYGTDDKTSQKLNILYDTQHKVPQRIPLIE